LDNRLETRHNAELLYQSFLGDDSDQWGPLTPFMEDKLTFDDRRNPRIQMADLVARETMKELDRLQSEKPRERRRSLTALASMADGRIQFEILTREYVEDWRRNADALAELMETTEHFSIPRYIEWLKVGNMPDNSSNRFSYMIWHNKQPKQ
jgi:hypothetical protein